MFKGELNEQQMSNVLSSQVIGRLACTDGKYPYVVPMTYIFDGTCILAQSIEGKKIDIMRRNPHVCLQVDMVIDLSTWQSVIVYGLFEELAGMEAINAHDALYDKVMPLMTINEVHTHEHAVSENNILPDDRATKNIMFKIRVNEKTGRFSKI